jgi:hypothetical protein
VVGEEKIPFSGAIGKTEKESLNEPHKHRIWHHEKTQSQEIYTPCSKLALEKGSPALPSLMLCAIMGSHVKRGPMV